jgi:hypothetical protein
MSRDWRDDADAAEEFFGLLGATVDQRLDSIAATARALLSDLKAGTCRYRRSAINRWAVRHLDLCARTFCRPPPVELVALVEHQLGVASGARNSNRKNREKFIAAAHHVAQYPDNTPAQIARAIEYDQKRVIAMWLEDQEFQEIVSTRRLRLAHQQKAGT